MNRVGHFRSAALDVKAFSEKNGAHRERSVYLIRNAKISPQWEEVQPRLERIAVRYDSEKSCENGIKSVGTNAPGAKIEDLTA